ncbi:MAG: cupin domain-containing protein [Reyranella sp.]|nr:cupin domain-containing protein [Reyranella sp.]
MSIYAGCVSPTHRHPNCNETIALLSGQATSIVDGEEYVLKAGDVVFVPRGAAHTIRNDGSQIAIAMLSYSAGVRIYEAIDSESI